MRRACEVLVVFLGYLFLMVAWLTLASIIVFGVIEFALVVSSR